MQSQTQTVRLQTPLPCGSWAGNDAGMCGKPATVAIASRATVFPGAWNITPVCPSCAAAGRPISGPAGDLAALAAVDAAYAGGAR